MMAARHELDHTRLKRVGAVIGIAAWLGVAIAVATACFSIALLSSATFFGDPPTDAMRREGLLFSLVGIAAAAAGPFGVWFFHRHRAWVYLGIAVVILGFGCALYILTV